MKIKQRQWLLEIAVEQQILAECLLSEVVPRFLNQPTVKQAGVVFNPYCITHVSIDYFYLSLDIGTISIALRNVVIAMCGQNKTGDTSPTLESQQPYLIMCSFLCHFSFGHKANYIKKNKLKKKKKSSHFAMSHQFPLPLSLSFSVPLSLSLSLYPPPTHTHAVSRTAEKR